MSKITDNPEFEADILHVLLSDRKLMEAYAPALKEEYLSRPEVQQVWAIARAYFERYKQLPTQDVIKDKVMLTYRDDNDKEKRQRETHIKFLTELYDRPNAPVDYVKDRLTPFLKGKALHMATVDTVDDLEAGNFSDAIVTRFTEALKVGEVKHDLGTRISQDTLKIIHNECDPSHRPPIPTGLTHFDMELGGGLRPGDLGIMMAPPKGFKSGTLLNFAFAGAKTGVDVNVLYITLELSEELQALRFAQRITMMGKWQMMENPEQFSEYWSRRKSNIFSPGKDIWIKYFAPYECTPNKIRQYMDAVKAEHGITFGLGCLDYMNLMGADEKKEKDYLEKVHIATALRAIGHDYNMPWWTAARANREEQSAKKPGMAHMGAAYEWVGIADYVYAMRRFRKEGTMHLIPVASRNEGGNHKVICKCEPEYMALQSIGIEEMDDDKDEDEGDMDKRKKKGKDPEIAEVEAIAKGLRREAKKRKDSASV